MRAFLPLLAALHLTACAIAAPTVPRSSLSPEMFAGYAFVDEDLPGHRIAFDADGTYTETVPLDGDLVPLTGQWRLENGLLCLDGALRSYVCLEVGRHREIVTLSNQSGALMRGRLEPTATASTD